MKIINGIYALIILIVIAIIFYYICKLVIQRTIKNKPEELKVLIEQAVSEALRKDSLIK